jgi:PPM family protein phosphatase
MDNMFDFEIYGGSDKGLVRENNEDSIGYELFNNAEIALAIVADGVGGYEGGEVASNITVDVIKESTRKAAMLAKSGAGYSEQWMQQTLLNAFEEANLEIIHQQSNHALLKRMASTVVAILCREDRIVLSHYGDSRCYMWRNEQLTQLTKDHSVAQQMLDEGVLTEENYHLSPYHHMISHAMGLEKVVDADALESQIENSDLFLLCSDGLTNCLNDDSIVEIIKKYSDIQICADELISQANDSGGIDNISVVLVKCQSTN